MKIQVMFLKNSNHFILYHPLHSVQLEKFEDMMLTMIERKDFTYIKTYQTARYTIKDEVKLQMILMQLSLSDMFILI